MGCDKKIFAAAVTLDNTPEFCQNSAMPLIAERDNHRLLAANKLQFEFPGFGLLSSQIT